MRNFAYFILDDTILSVSTMKNKDIYSTAHLQIDHHPFVSHNKIDYIIIFAFIFSFSICFCLCLLLTPYLKCWAFRMLLSFVSFTCQTLAGGKHAYAFFMISTSLPSRKRIEAVFILFLRC